MAFQLPRVWGSASVWFVPRGCGILSHRSWFSEIGLQAALSLSPTVPRLWIHSGQCVSTHSSPGDCPGEQPLLSGGTQTSPGTQG